MGWRFRRRKARAPAPTDLLFATLKARGLSPRHMVDIGGNHGNWTRAALAAFPEARLSMFESQQKLAEKHVDLARSEHASIHYKGVGDFGGSSPFNFRASKAYA